MNVKLFLEDTRPIIEQTILTASKVFNTYYEETGNRIEMDGESFADVFSHLAIVYHLLVVSVTEAITEGKDINTETQRILRTIRQLSSGNKEFNDPESEAKVREFVEVLFSKSKGSA